MPIYIYQHPQTGELFEEIRTFKGIDDPFVAPDGAKCTRVLFSQGIRLIDKNAEVWEKDPAYVKSLHPRYVKRRDGIREKYDPTRHC